MIRHTPLSELAMGHSKVLGHIANTTVELKNGGLFTSELRRYIPMATNTIRQIIQDLFS